MERPTLSVNAPTSRGQRLVYQTMRLVRALRGRIESLRALATARSDSLARIGEPDVGRILVVCYGNIYRSAFVDAYFGAHPIAGVEVRSAGLHPEAGRKSPPRHVVMTRAKGVDLGPHRSRVLVAGDLNWAQVTVLMDRHNWQALVARGADRRRLVWLGAFDGGAIEIPDPYRLDDAQAAGIVDRLAACSAGLAAKLTGCRRSTPNG